MHTHPQLTASIAGQTK